MLPYIAYMDPMGYASIKLSRLVPSHHLPTALRPQGAPFLLATRRKTPGCGTRASPYAESQASNGSPEGTPIELQYNLGLFGDIWGLFGDYFGYILGMPLGESTNQPIPDLSSLDIRLLRDDRTTPRPVVGNER